MCHNLAVKLLDGIRLAFLLQSKGRSSLVDQIDSFVWQEALCDVTVRVSRSGHKRSVGNTNTVVDFVTVFDTSKD